MAERKDTEIGILPSDWAIGTFAEDLEVHGRIGWRGYRTGDLVEQGPMVIGGTEIKSTFFLHLDNVQHLSRSKFEESPEIQLKEGDILLVTRGNLGEVGYFHGMYGEATINPSVIILDKFSGDSRFLFYYLISKQGRDNVLSLSSGSSVPAIYQAHVKLLKYPRPSLGEQKAIANTLLPLDSKIDLLHRQNKTMEAMAETVWRQWFVEEAEDKWENRTLGDIAINIREVVDPNDALDGTPYVGLEHIERRHVVLYQYGMAHEVTSQKAAFKKGDILFGKLRPYFHKVCFAPFDGVCSTDILVIRSTHPLYSAYSLFAFFQKEVVDYSDISSEGTRMPRTSWEILGKYPIKSPDQSKLNEFNRVVLPMMKKMDENRNHIGTLTQMRDTLLPKLMSGEVRVTESKKR